MADPRNFVAYHPSILKYTYVLTIREDVPSKRSFLSAQEAADNALAFGVARYGDNLLNIKVLCGTETIDSLRK